MELAQLAPRRLGARLAQGIDGPLLGLSLALVALGLVDAVLGELRDSRPRHRRRSRNIAVALAAMWVVAQVPPQTLMRFAVPAYVLGLALLVAVALVRRRRATARAAGCTSASRASSPPR